MALKNLGELQTDKIVKKSTIQEIQKRSDIINIFQEPTELDLYADISISSSVPEHDYLGKGFMRDVYLNFSKFIVILFDPSLEIDLINDFNRSFDIIIDYLNVNVDKLKLDIEYLKQFYLDLLEEFSLENPDLDYVLAYYLSVFMNKHISYAYIGQDGRDVIFYPTDLYSIENLEIISEKYFKNLKKLMEKQ